MRNERYDSFFKDAYNLFVGKSLSHIILVIRCCVTNYPRTLVTSNNEHLLSHTVSVHQELRSA